MAKARNGKGAEGANGEEKIDIEAILRDETTCVISDSTYPTQGLVHPRVYGTYVRLFERYVRRGVLSPEQAVRKVTALPAARPRQTAACPLPHGPSLRAPRRLSPH